MNLIYQKLRNLFRELCGNPEYRFTENAIALSKILKKILKKQWLEGKQHVFFQISSLEMVLVEKGKMPVQQSNCKYFVRLVKVIIFLKMLIDLGTTQCEI